jgi:hypothetical protein
MKPLVLFLLYLLISKATYAQNYKFDLLTSYSSKVNGKQNKRIVYSDSKNDDFFLSVGGFTGSSKATLIDFKKRVYHHFKVIQTKENKDIFFTFVYISTTEFETPDTYIDHNFVFEEIESDSIFRKVKVLIYKNSKNKKPITSHTVILKKSDNKLFSLYRVSCLHPFEILDKMKYPGNYMVVSGTGTTSNGYKIETKLVLTKTIYFEMNVPN